MAHHHGPGDGRGEQVAWVICIILQAALVIVEWQYQRLTHSGALLSDWLHNSSDVLQAFISGLPTFLLWFGLDGRWRWWRHRCSRLAEAVNVGALVGSGLWAIGLGWIKLHQSAVVDYDRAWPVAAASCGVNVVCFVLIHRFPAGRARTYAVHLFWDVVATFVAWLSLLRGAVAPDPLLDPLATIVIGLMMLLHWPVVWGVGGQKNSR